MPLAAEALEVLDERVDLALALPGSEHVDFCYYCGALVRYEREVNRDLEFLYGRGKADRPYALVARCTRCKARWPRAYVQKCPRCGPSFVHLYQPWRTVFNRATGRVDRAEGLAWCDTCHDFFFFEWFNPTDPRVRLIGLKRDLAGRALDLISGRHSG